jgi:hypothetical protein
MPFFRANLIGLKADRDKKPGKFTRAAFKIAVASRSGDAADSDYTLNLVHRRKQLLVPSEHSTPPPEGKR